MSKTSEIVQIPRDLSHRAKVLLWIGLSLRYNEDLPITCEKQALQDLVDKVKKAKAAKGYSREYYNISKKTIADFCETFNLVNPYKKASVERLIADFQRLSASEQEDFLGRVKAKAA